MNENVYRALLSGSWWNRRLLNNFEMKDYVRLLDMTPKQIVFYLEAPIDGVTEYAVRYDDAKIMEHLIADYVKGYRQPDNARRFARMIDSKHEAVRKFAWSTRFKPPEDDFARISRYDIIKRVAGFSTKWATLAEEKQGLKFLDTYRDSQYQNASKGAFGKFSRYEVKVAGYLGEVFTSALWNGDYEGLVVISGKENFRNVHVDIHLYSQQSPQARLLLEKLEAEGKINIS